MNFKCASLVSGAMLIVCLIGLSSCQSNPVKSGALEWPPSFSTAVEKAPIVKFCELVSKPDQYNEKIVRTRGNFWGNKENQVLYASECQSSKEDAWVEFDRSYEYSEEALKKDFDRVLCPRVPCPVQQAVVEFVGRFEGPNDQGYGHLDSYRYRFSVMRVTKVEPSN
ncbi:MAG TPA: hypothetical protein VNO50_21995 [Pyrinomonadaceae bacterium]|nr:hypothetical protein [Pyrinomonadaceae bacterium]